MFIGPNGNEFIFRSTGEDSADIFIGFKLGEGEGVEKKWSIFSTIDGSKRKEFKGITISTLKEFINTPEGEKSLFLTTHYS